MTATTIRVQMAQRKDTAANWTAANPILLSGEIGYETDTKKFKIGNGSTNWNSLAYLPIPDGSGNLTITGNLEIGSTGSLTFEGSTADGFETTLAVTNPTADRTITLPNQSGTVLVSGNASIVDADIAANAEIAVSKLADGTARQLLQTDAAGTGVEWTSNVDIPGTLDVTGAATFDAAVTVAGDLTVSGRLGVGTSSPSASLSVASTTTSYTAESFNIGEPSLSTGRQLYMGYNTADGVGFIQPVHWGTEFKPLVLCPNGGRVGIGTTAPSYALDVRTTGTSISSLFTSDQSEQYIALKDSGTTIGHVRLGSTSGSMLFFAGNGERGRFDSSGRLLVGTSSARSNFYNATTTTSPNLQLEGTTYSQSSLSLVNNNSSTVGGFPMLIMAKSAGDSVGSNTPVSDGHVLGQFTFQGNDGSEFVVGATISAVVDGISGANDLPTRLVFSTTADGASSPTERMRISNEGKIYANTTADPVGPSDVIIHAARTNGNAFGATVTTAGYTCYTVSSVTNGYAMWMYNTTASANVGSILINTSSVSYTTTSDYRLKENVTPVNDGIARLQQLKPSRFNFIADPDTTVDGFIAHEVQTIVPEAITGEKDAVDDDGNPIYQGIDQSKLMPLLTAALQEAIGEIESLKVRVAALESA